VPKQEKLLTKAFIGNYEMVMKDKKENLNKWAIYHGNK
jgi:hypothetical protein